MASEPISQLTQITLPSATDVVPIVSQGSTYKVSLNTLVQAASATAFGQPFIYKTGNVLVPGGIFSNSVAPTINTATVFPCVIAQPLTVSGIICNLQATPTSGMVVQMGIYNSTTGNMPGTLITGSTATLSPTATGTTTTTYTYGTNVFLSPGIYWLAAVQQNYTGNVRTFSTCDLFNFPSSTLTTSVITGYTMTVTGALPSTFAISGTTTNAIAVYLTMV